MRPPVEIQTRRRLVQKVGDGSRFARRDDVVVRLVLLEHEPHRLDVVAGKAPVPPRLEVTEIELVLQAELYPRQRARDLARHERLAPTRALVIEQDAARRVQAEA